MLKNIVKNYHHYKKNDIMLESDRVAVVERKVVDLILQSNLTEDRRESSATFELKHSSATTQFARLLARKRYLDLDICAVGAVLHDIHVIVNGTYKNHAHLGGGLAEGILNEIGGFCSEERNIINRLIVNHSDKHIFSDDPYIEFGKDVDVLDCFFYPDAIEYYLKNKPINQMKQYLCRAKKLWDDLNIPKDSSLLILDNYQEGWLDSSVKLQFETLAKLIFDLDLNCDTCKGSPIFFASLTDEKLYFNAKEVDCYVSQNSNDFSLIFQELVKGNRIGFDTKLLNLPNSSVSGIIVWTPIGKIQLLDSLEQDVRKKELIGEKISYV